MGQIGRFNNQTMISERDTEHAHLKLVIITIRSIHNQNLVLRIHIIMYTV